MEKTYNLTPAVKDIEVFCHTLSDLSAGSVDLLWYDPDRDVEVIGIYFIPEATYIASQNTTVTVTTVTEAETFTVGSYALGTAEIAANVVTALSLIDGDKIVYAGDSLRVTVTASGSQTGTGYFACILRPMDTEYASSKYPGGSVTAVT